MAQVARPWDDWLPKEIREIIWDYAVGGDGYRHDGPGRLIEVQFTGHSAYYEGQSKISKPRRSHGSRFRSNRYPAQVKYKYLMRSPDRTHLLRDVDRQSRKIFDRHNPYYFQLNEGQKIYFKQDRDRIFLDKLSLFFLRNYNRTYPHWVQLKNFRGPEEIHKLAIPGANNFRLLGDLRGVFMVMGHITDVSQEDNIPNAANTAQDVQNRVQPMIAHLRQIPSHQHYKIQRILQREYDEVDASRSTGGGLYQTIPW